MTPTPTSEQIKAEWSTAFQIASIWVNYQPLHSEVTRAIATALATARLEGEQMGRNNGLDEAVGIARSTFVSESDADIAGYRIGNAILVLKETADE